MKLKLPKRKGKEEEKENQIEEMEGLSPEEAEAIRKQAEILRAVRELEEEEDEDKKKGAGLILRRRALGRAAKRIARARKLTLLLAGMALLLTLIFVFSVTQEKMGNFTININRMEMYRQGIMLADNDKFENPSSRLKANAVQNATNISIMDLPDNLESIDGEHNGTDYMAYTFYIRNGGRETVDYYYNIIIEMQAKGVDAAVRVAVYDDNGRTVYAKKARNGKAEAGTTPFIEDTVVMENYVRNFVVNDVDKYTVVVWLEGDDPECVDAIIGGMIRMSMNFDIADPIADNKPTDHIIDNKTT